MGTGRVNKQDHDPSSKGIALVEVLVSMVFLTVAMVAMLECLAHALEIREAAGRQWKKSLQKWNQIQVLRSTFETGEPVAVLPGAQPISRFFIAADDSGELLPWEVLRAPR